MAEGFSCPGCGSVFVTFGAGIRDFVFVGHVRGDEGESVGADFDVGEGGSNFGHVAGDAAAAG